jgi:ribonuclease J
LKLVVHRGTQQIGGSCIELRAGSGERLILDAGRPLDAPEGATGLLPESLDRSAPATVLISHPHQDHWGLICHAAHQRPRLSGRPARIRFSAPAENGGPDPRLQLGCGAAWLRSRQALDR